MRPYRGGVLLNDTAAGQVACYDREGVLVSASPVLKFDQEQLEMTHLPKDHARQAFARGLCDSRDGVIFGGSSPSTISAYRLGAPSALKTVNLTMDIRNSIHGLEIWPF